MKLPLDAPKVIEYCCNICGGKNQLETENFQRELALCKQCGANARFRGIIYVLSGLIGEKLDLPLRKWSRRRQVRGIGMSDWPGYANLLRSKFNYENTFFDRRPKLDILNPEEKHIEKYDFVISTDVFEHIVAPVQRGFDNLFRLLKPGGNLVLSVPTTRIAHTVEHFPDLYEFEFYDFYGRKILVNRDASGHFQLYHNLVFHGGEGSTLEMRRFCEADVIDRLTRAGFEKIQVHDQPQLSIGYYWPELKPPYPSVPVLYGYILSSRRPARDFVLYT